MSISDGLWIALGIEVCSSGLRQRSEEVKDCASVHSFRLARSAVRGDGTAPRASLSIRMRVSGRSSLTPLCGWEGSDITQAAGVISLPRCWRRPRPPPSSGNAGVFP